MITMNEHVNNDNIMNDNTIQEYSDKQRLSMLIRLALCIIVLAFTTYYFVMYLIPTHQGEEVKLGAVILCAFIFIYTTTRIKMLWSKLFG